MWYIIIENCEKKIYQKATADRMLFSIMSPSGDEPV